MYDLFLTKSGDLSFLTTNTLAKNETFTLNFHIAKSDSLLFNFSVDGNTELRPKPNQLTFNFYLYKPKYDKIARTVTDYNYINQAIKIRLNTELGSIRGNENLGSTVFDLMHSSIPEDRLRNQIREITKKAISDILPNATVDVQLLNTDYLNYHDSIRIVIVNNEELYYYTI